MYINWTMVCHFCGRANFARVLLAIGHIPYSLGRSWLGFKGAQFALAEQTLNPRA